MVFKDERQRLPAQSAHETGAVQVRELRGNLPYMGVDI